VSHDNCSSTQVGLEHIDFFRTWQMENSLTFAYFSVRRGQKITLSMTEAGCKRPGSVRHYPFSPELKVANFALLLSVCQFAELKIKLTLFDFI